MPVSFRRLSWGLLLVAAACQGGAEPEPQLVSGVLMGGPGPSPGVIAGVPYTTATRSGLTGSDGAFDYLEGETVTFAPAGVSLRPAPGAPFLSPWQLSGTGACTADPELARLLVLLEGLDLDGDPSNGLSLDPGDLPADADPLTSLSDADLASRVEERFPGRVLVDPAAALDAYMTRMDGEDWEQIGLTPFDGAVGLTRSQGVATDGASFYFSWQLGLEKTGLDFEMTANNQTAIPESLQDLGSNHIGDIDWWDGTLYLPIEDGSDYLNPVIARYDPDTLTVRDTFPLSGTLLTEGVPWVAVDGPRSKLYVAEWDPTPELHVYDLATVTYERSIPLGTVMHRIQGAKVFEGSLYLSTDDDVKGIYKVNLDTGAVLPLFAFHAEFEEEGLVFLAMPDGSLMHTLNITYPVRGTELRHHRRTRDPLRKAVCP